MTAHSDLGVCSAPSFKPSLDRRFKLDPNEGQLVGQVLTISDLSQQDQEAWRKFLSRQPVAFLSYPYVCAFASQYPLVRITRIMTLDRRAVAYFPFQYRSVAHAIAGIGERLGGELSDYFGLIAEPGFRVEMKTLLHLSRIKSLHFTHLDENQRDKGLVGEKREIGHRIDFPNGGEVFWNEKKRSDRKFVSDTERRERKLIREYGPIRFVFSENDPIEPLKMVITEKRAQYHRTHVGDVLSGERTRAVLHALCKTHEHQCSGMVSTLYAGDTWVASHFGLRCDSTLHYWFPVYNPALSAFAPGRMLLRQIILCARAHGLERIDRGAGDSVAKRELATSQHVFHAGLWQRPGAIALAHRIGLAIGWRVTRYRMGSTAH